MPPGSATRLEISGIALHELSPQQASLEQAFIAMTRDEVEFHTHPAEDGSRA